MATLKSPRPTTRKSSSKSQFRQRIPLDLVQQVRGLKLNIPVGPDIVPVRVGSKAVEITLSLRTADPRETKIRHATVLAYLGRVYEGLRSSTAISLTHRDAVAITAAVYRGWEMESMNDTLIRELGGREGAVAAWASADARMEQEDATGRATEKLAPIVDGFLLDMGLRVDGASKEMLREEAVRFLRAAYAKQMRAAAGDYAPDPVAAQIPDVRSISSGAAGLTFDKLIEKWKAARAPSPASVKAYTLATDKLKAYVKHDDPTRVTAADMRGLRDTLVAQGLKPASVKAGNLAPIRALYAYGIDSSLLTHNPADKVKDERKKQAGESMLPYDDEEVADILAMADAETNIARHWVPWLVATTGARVTEITQLWATHVKKVNGIDVISITPTDDGGRLKNAGSERDVPLHPAIIKRGFLEFVKSRKGGPLFYGKPGAKPTNKTERLHHTAVGVSSKLGVWIRSKGYTNPRKAPNHAFRHWFKSVCPEFGILDSQANAIQGHKGRDGEADRYRHRRIKAMHDAVCRLKLPTKSKKR